MASSTLCDLVSLLPRCRCCCCCLRSQEDREPLRAASLSAGISSSDPKPFGHGLQRSANEVTAEAIRAQEWCLENLAEPQARDAPRKEDDGRRRHTHRKQRRLEASSGVELAAAAGSSTTTWELPDGPAEAHLDAAVAALLPKLEAIPSGALITKVSSMSGNLAELLVVAQLVADRVSTDGAVLVRAGCFAWLAAALRRTDVLSSAAAAHRLCYATRCVLEAFTARSQLESSFTARSQLEASGAVASASTPTGVQATLLVRSALRRLHGECLQVLTTAPFPTGTLGALGRLDDECKGR